ncbi:MULTISPECIES: flagellar motor switch protein FliG [unclassified Methylobacterium]|uniref:flagellar motor switch protein FliG n=1 Tax=unclassified Methylobacterium TaxID=2615210 RepID=UPI001FBA61C1|nr:MULTISPECIES: flagellar motor switch protein FliG [unclassified Methylobacterium]MCJ2090936.1 flagellar motor switch protein FliG [Methylobacterium sp. J-072]MCJ2143771.1 flagellar motor switch protein FliG [Methylobacterium sp. E-066]
MAAGPVTKTTRVLNPAEEVAAVLIAMNKGTASRLVKYFDNAELRQITRAVAQLGPVSRSQLESIIEAVTAFFTDGANLIGTAREMEKLLEGNLPPEQIASIMADVLGQGERSVWDRISNGAEAALASYLLKEHPQTAALILSKVKPACAAKVMAQLPAPLRNGVMRRMLTFKPIVDGTMKMIEQTMHEDFMINQARNAGADTHARMADIINKMERQGMEEVLDSLAQSRPKSAEILKSLLFTFDDIINMTPRARTSLFDQIPPDRIILALKGTSGTLRNVVLGAITARTRRLVEHELEGGEPASQRDVLEARRAITDQALEMAARGEIELNQAESEDTFFS